MDAAPAHSSMMASSGTSISSNDIELHARGFNRIGLRIVRGKPSNRPLRTVGLGDPLLTRPMMMSSLTRPPASITFLPRHDAAGA